MTKSVTIYRGLNSICLAVTLTLLFISNSLNAEILSWSANEENPELTVSTSLHWSPQITPTPEDGLRFNMGTDNITWDSPIRIDSILLERGFQGQLKSDGDRIVSSDLTVNGGTLVTDATLQTARYSQSSEATLEIGLTDGINGVVDIEERATLAGRLVLNSTFSLSQKRIFDILNWGDLEGRFDDIQLPPLSQGLAWNLDQLYIDGTVAIVDAPGEINSTPLLWLDASDRGSLITGTAAESTSAEVTAWIDKSGNNLHCRQSSNLSLPELITSGNFSQNALRFDGSNDFLQIADQGRLDLLGDKTIFIVGTSDSQSSSTASVNLFLSKLALQNGFPGWMVYVRDRATSTDDFVYYSDGGTTTPELEIYNGEVSDNTAIWTILRNGVNISGHHNGHLGNQVSANAPTAPNTPLMIGKSELENFQLRGNISEIIIFPHALSTADRQAIETYLNNKYSDTISPTLIRHYPESGATQSAVDTDLILTFDRNIESGTGNIVLKNTDNAADTYSLPITAPEIEFNNNSLVIRAPFNLDTNTTYELSLQHGVIQDSLGNPFPGTIDGQIQFTTLDPTSSTVEGVISLSDYLLPNTATLTLSLDSTREGDYGRIDASGTVTLSGNLNIELTVAEEEGQIFDILNWSGTLQGTFADIVLPRLATGLAWDLSNLYIDGTLRIISLPWGVSTSPLLWLDASDSGSISHIDNRVTHWVDKSGNSASGTAIGDPMTQTRSLNGHNVIELDGNDYTVHADVAAGSNITLFVVAQIDEVNETTDALFAYKSAASGGNDFQLDAGNPTDFRYRTYSDTHSHLITESDWSNQFHIFGYTSNATLEEALTFIDGDPNGSATDYTTRYDSSGDIHLFSNRARNHQPIGAAAEVILFDTVLSSTERRTIEQYLADKYAIDLASSEPPQWVDSTPSHESSDIHIDAPITLHFDKNIEAITIEDGQSGQIVITNSEEPNDNRSLSLDDHEQVEIVGRTLTLHPSLPLLPNSTYDLTISANTLSDLSGRTFAGIQMGELRFSTERDSDLDSIPDRYDLDDDNDGISDSLEGGGFLDSDEDGFPDSIDLDSDGDGLLDITESAGSLIDANLDAQPDTFIDTNGDGLDDRVAEGFAPADTDGNGTADYLEIDSDKDGITDDLEHPDQYVRLVDNLLYASEDETLSAIAGGSLHWTLLILLIGVCYKRRER